MRGNRDEDVPAAEAELKRLEAIAAMSQDEARRVEKLVCEPGDLLDTKILEVVVELQNPSN